MLSRIRDAYRRTAKPKDIFWNKVVARPLAAVLIVPLQSTRVTPNQITFGSLALFLVAGALLVLVPGQAGLIAAVAALQASYVLDCADGQLARLRGTSTPIGAHLDFLMDELKAFLLVACAGVRLYHASGDVRFLIEGAFGVAVVAAGISLTSFVRRPEYAAATGTRVTAGAGDYGQGFAAAPDPVGAPRVSLVRRGVRLVESFGRFVIHYPSSLVYVALIDRLDVFLHAYLIVNAAYAARTLMGVALKLGRFAR